MIRRLMCAGILVSTLGIMFARHASAGITFASASGPGGSVTNLAIGTTVTTDDSIGFDANYTSRAPIDFFLTLTFPRFMQLRSVYQPAHYLTGRALTAVPSRTV
jgi:hypothetical protein